MMNSPTGFCKFFPDDSHSTPIDDADKAMNQYTATPTDLRNYDDNGNLTSLKNDPVGSTLAVSCLYDYRNRMVEYRDAATGQRHTYAYDALGRRIAKTIDADSASPATTRYFYGGESQWQVCEERVPDSGPPGTKRTTATYVYGRYIDEVLQMQHCGTGILPVDCTPGAPQDYYYHADDLYNVMAITDANGSVVERYEYGDYGEPIIMAPDGTMLASSSIRNPYLFTGRRYDPETQWYCYRTRYLDPTSGKFTTRDVIGIWGDPAEFGNGYSYVGDNPLSWLDPLGVSKKARGGYWNGKAEVEVTLPSGKTVTIYAENMADLVKKLKELKSKAKKIDVYDHGGPGFQEVGNDDAAIPGLSWKRVCENVEEDGEICLHGCNVADDDEDTDTEDDGKKFIQSLADNGKRKVVAWTGRTYYIPLPFGGGIWYIESGERIVAKPK